ncbi:RNA polymerase sigma factor [Spirillospora sp. NPDC127200]
MNDHRLVAALRARETGAPDAVYAAYADRLYAYCWFRLRSQDAAQVALRDTFIVAEAHIDRLCDPARFGPWLYALARLECARRPAAPDQAPDIAVASHDQDDVDQRIMAWQAVLGMPAAGREMLDLWVRHGLPVSELAAVLGLTALEAQAALKRAHTDLEAALTAELLAAQGPYGCAERGMLLRERHGGPSPESSGRLLAHARVCPECGPFRPDPVSAAKVYGLLPRAVPPDALRARVVACFMDPELVGYRLFVATRLADFMPDGFPAVPRGAEFLGDERRDSPKRGAATVRLTIALGVSVLLLGGGAGAVHLTGQQSRGDRPVPDSLPRPFVPPASPPSSVPPAHVGERSVENLATAPVSATYPLGATASAAPPTALPSPPPRRDYHSAPGEKPLLPLPPGVSGTLSVSPYYLDLAGGSDGAIELRAEGGPVNWTASAQGPVRPARSSGRLEAGQAIVLGVHVFRSPDAQGEGGITFQPGGVKVHITWRPGQPPTSPPTRPPTGPPTDRPTSPPPTTPLPPTSRPPSPSTPPGSSEPPPTPPPPGSEPPPENDPPPSDPSPSDPSPSGPSPSAPSPSRTPSSPPPPPASDDPSSARRSSEPPGPGG